MEEHGIYVDNKDKHYSPFDGDGGVTSTVPINKGDTKKRVKKPTFKNLFKDYKLHHPDLHRLYLYTQSKGIQGVSQAKSFNKKNVELITVQKEGVNHVTVSTEFVNYLKSQDEAFVMGAGYLQDQVNFTNSKRLYKNQHYYKFREGQYNDAVSALSSHQSKFKNFISDLSNSLLDLNKPILFDNEGGEDIPVSVGSFDCIELDKFVNNIFGDVTNKKFVPMCNKNVHELKQETNCCLNLCGSQNTFRKKDEAYEDSKQKIKDDIKYEEYQSSPDYTPDNLVHKPMVITTNSFVHLFHEANSLLDSPLLYVFKKMKPYIEEFLSNKKGVTDYKITDNSVSIDLDLRIIFKY